MERFGVQSAGALGALEEVTPGGDWWRAWLPGAPEVALGMADGERLACAVALRFGQRARGLLGSVPDALGGRALVFPRCASLHTFGMGYALDVAFADGCGRIMRSERGVAPGHIVDAGGAVVAMERAASGRPWPVEGERVAFEKAGLARAAGVGCPLTLRGAPAAGRGVALGEEQSMETTGIHEDPRELFDMRLAHVGINAKDATEAAVIAQQFQDLLHLGISTTPVSHFADTMVEIMDGGGRGEHGHIGFHVNDLLAAAAWFDAHGYEIDQQSWNRYPDGRPHLVYFARPIAGFAIHLTQD